MPLPLPLSLSLSAQYHYNYISFVLSEASGSKDDRHKPNTVLHNCSDFFDGFPNGPKPFSVDLAKILLIQVATH